MTPKIPELSNNRDWKPILLILIPLVVMGLVVVFVLPICCQPNAEPIAAYIQSGIPPIQGSGIVMNEAGDILTALHVVRSFIEPANNIEVHFSDTDGQLQAQSADLIGMAPCHDLALLRLRDGLSRSMPSVEIQTEVTQDNELTVYGYSGIALSEDATIQMSTITGKTTSSLRSYRGYSSIIEHTAITKKGFSGGPVFLGSKLVGISLQEDELSYAISGEVLKQLFNALRSETVPEIYPMLPKMDTIRIDYPEQMACYRLDFSSVPTTPNQPFNLTFNLTANSGILPHIQVYTNNRLVGYNTPSGQSDTFTFAFDLAEDYFVAVGPSPYSDDRDKWGKIDLELKP